MTVLKIFDITVEKNDQVAIALHDFTSQCKSELLEINIEFLVQQTTLSLNSKKLLNLHYLA